MGALYDNPLATARQEKMSALLCYSMRLRCGTFDWVSYQKEKNLFPELAYVKVDPEPSNEVVSIGGLEMSNIKRLAVDPSLSGCCCRIQTQ
jgi:hypothetical protein